MIKLSNIISELGINTPIGKIVMEIYNKYKNTIDASIYEWKYENNYSLDDENEEEMSLFDVVFFDLQNATSDFMELYNDQFDVENDKNGNDLDRLINKLYYEI